MQRVTECPVCRASESTLVTRRGRDFGPEQAIYACHDCTAFYLSPRYSETELAEFYAGDYSRRYRGQEEPEAAGIAWRDRIAAERFAQLREWGALPSQGERLLELGCGAGNFLKLCTEVGVDAYGIEPSQGYAGYAIRQGLPVEVGSFPERSGPYPSYHAIALFHVLEHLPDPRESLQQIRDRLEPGGRLFVEVPELSRALGWRFSERYFHAPHLVDYTDHSLRRLLLEAGFRPTHEVYGPKQRRHHLLIVSEKAESAIVLEPDRSVLKRVRRWIKIARVTRPLYVALREARGWLRVTLPHKK